ncbi:hypothetical protein CFSAN002367_24216, partial [Clostridium botulinum CFSAN002367]
YFYFETHSFIFKIYSCFLKIYSLLRAITGSFLAAIFDGIAPPIIVRTILVITNAIACNGFN